MNYLLTFPCSNPDCPNDVYATSSEPIKYCSDCEELS